MSSLRLRLFVREKYPSVRTARAIRWKKLSSVLMARYCSKPLSLEPFTTNLSKNVSLNDLRNSSKRYLPSPHEFSRYIFRWIALFAFITFDYRYQFQSRLSYNYVLTFKRFWSPWKYTLTVNKLCLSKIPSSSFTNTGKKQSKASI